MAFSGIIPTINVSSNSTINSAVNGVVDKVATGAVNIAVNSLLGAETANFLGFQATNPTEVLGSVTSGLISAGSQVLNQTITDTIVNSGALGPAGPLVASVATSVVNNLTSDLTNSLFGGEGGLGGLFGGTGISQQASRYFPGAGDEEDADYGGYLYTPGPVGPDVVFSIKPAQNSASTEAASNMFGNQTGVAASIPFGEIPDVGAGQLLSSDTQAAIMQSSMGTLFSGEPLTGVPGGGFDPSLGAGLTGGGNSSLSSGFNTATLSPNTGSTFVNPPFSSDASQSFSAFDQTSTFLESPVPATGTSGFFNVASNSASSFTNDDILSDYSSKIDTSGIGQSGAEDTGGWKFTTAPADITWDSVAKVDRVPIFGTNQPPVISGSRGMRDLNLSNALIEGFSMIKSVEGKIAKLEALLNYTLTTSYVKVPVYWVTASDKKYGDGNNDGGFFVIKQIKVKEEMRDLTGRSTRALVDVSFTQVPAYQVDDGRDLASKSVAGGKSILGSVNETFDKAIKEGRKDGTIAVIDQNAANPASTSNSSGSGSNPKPGKVDLGGGVTADATIKKTDKNGVTYVLRLDPQTGKYIPIPDFNKKYPPAPPATPATPTPQP